MRSLLAVVLFVFGSALAACGHVDSVPDGARAPDSSLPDAPPPDAGPTNLIVNGAFNTDTLNWTAVNTELALVSGGLELKQAVAGGPGLGWQLVNLTGGKTYTLNARFIAGSYPGSYQVRAGTNVNLDEYGVVVDPAMPAVFTAPSGGPTTVWITLNNVSTMVGEYAVFDDVTLYESP
jgi:hypothetical protein